MVKVAFPTYKTS